jgi:acyl-CoA thioesterase-1
MVGAVLALAACAASDSPPPDSNRGADGNVSTSLGQRGEAPEADPQSTRRDPLGATVDNRPIALIVGTSLTAGYGLDSPEFAYPAILQAKADSAGVPVRIVNAGLSGETSAGAVRRLDWLLGEEPRLVIVETGANDGLRGLDPDSTAANLAAIVERVRARYPAAVVALVQMEAPPNLGADYTARFRAMYGDVARRAGARLLPFLLEGVAGDPALNQSDGIHPTEEGAKRVAENLWPAVLPLLRGAAEGSR